MKNQTNVALTLDLKKQRMRIHKETLRQVGYPDYVQLLVNPEQKTIVMRACEESACQAHKVILEKNVDCELYSKEFLRRLKTVDSNLKGDTSFLIAGKTDPSRRLAIFRLKDIHPLESGQSQKTTKREQSHYDR